MPTEVTNTKIAPIGYHLRRSARCYVPHAEHRIFSSSSENSPTGLDSPRSVITLRPQITPFGKPVLTSRVPAWQDTLAVHPQRSLVTCPQFSGTGSMV